MSIYTVSPDLLENIEEDERIYLTEILFVFTRRGCDFKVAKDKNGEIIDIYRSVKNNADFIKQWLELMSFKPAKFEKIDIDLKAIKCIESKFIELCSSTNNVRQMIVYSKQNIKTIECIDNYIMHKNKPILILDRDEANNTLNKVSTTYNSYNNSQIAMNGSSINDSNN